MVIDNQKLKDLIARPARLVAVDELRREGNVFLVGGKLPARDTLETLFDSHCQVPAEFFYLRFGDVDSFHLGEQLARQIKKNFNAYLMGRFDCPVPPHLVQHAYVAGVDIIDIPLFVFDGDLAAGRGLERDKRLKALENALSVFPRWSVASTLMVGEEPSFSTARGIDSLLALGVVPLLELSPLASCHNADEVAETLGYLLMEWKRKKVSITPFIPLVSLTTPLVQPRQGKTLRGFIDKLRDRSLLASSDLRRALRVRQVEESFESAGL